MVAFLARAQRGAGARFHGGRPRLPLDLEARAAGNAGLLTPTRICWPIIRNSRSRTSIDNQQSPGGLSDAGADLAARLRYTEPRQIHRRSGGRRRAGGGRFRYHPNAAGARPASGNGGDAGRRAYAADESLAGGDQLGRRTFPHQGYRHHRSRASSPTSTSSMPIRCRHQEHAPDRLPSSRTAKSSIATIIPGSRATCSRTRTMSYDRDVVDLLGKQG